MKQTEVEVYPVRRVLNFSAVSIDGAAPRGVGEVVDHHLFQPAARLIHFAGLEIELALGNGVDHLFLEQQRRLGLRDVVLERLQLVVGTRQHLVIEGQEADRHHHAANERRCDQPPRAHPICLERGDLVLRGQARVGVQHGHQHRHRHGEGDGERNGQQEKLPDRLGRQAFSHQLAELARDEIEQHDRRQRNERKREWPGVFSHDVTADDPHACAEKAGGARNVKSGTGL